MNEQLRLLLKLQNLDSDMLSARLTIDQIPGRISSEEEPLVSARQNCQKAEAALNALDKRKREKERLIDEIQEKIRKLRNRTSEIKTNKEYQAILREIEVAEKDLRSAEDDLLEILESLDEAALSLDGEKKRLVDEERRIEALKKMLAEEAAAQEEALNARKRERRSIVDGIDPSLYELYVSLLKSRRGLAVVETVNEICLGCNLHIPPQLFVQIKSSDEIFQCPQCKRILFHLKSQNDQTAANSPADGCQSPSPAG